MSASLFVPEGWTKVSSQYHAQTGFSTGPANARLLRYVTARKPFSAESYCLDVGTGSGSIPKEIEKMAPGTKVLATDLSPGMVEQVRALKIGGVEAQVEDATTLSGLKDESFSHVFTGFAIQYTTDMPATIRQMYRVLEKGGVAGICICGDYAGVVEVHNLACFRLKKDYKSIRHFNDTAWSSVEDHLKHLKAAGFRDVQADICLVPWRFGSVEEFCSFWFGSNPVPSRLVREAEAQGISQSDLRQSIKHVLEAEFESGKEVYLTGVLGWGEK